MQVDHCLCRCSVHLFQSQIRLVRGFSRDVGFNSRFDHFLASDGNRTVRKSAFQLCTPFEERARVYWTKARNSQDAITHDIGGSFYAIGGERLQPRGTNAGNVVMPNLKPIQIQP